MRREDSARSSRLQRRRSAEARGRRAEWFAALSLILKGYTILARRYRSRSGEIDIIAVRGKRLAFIEVKQRKCLDDAQIAVSVRQAERIARTAAAWIAEHPYYERHEVGLDAVQVVPWQWPRHWQGGCER